MCHHQTKERALRLVRQKPPLKRGAGSLTDDSVSVHVIQDVPEAEDPGGGGRRAASEQRGAELVAGSAGVEVRAGLERGAHAARQRAHLVRTAAAFDLASVALHAHFWARKIQRRRGGGDTNESKWREGEKKKMCSTRRDRTL